VIAEGNQVSIHYKLTADGEAIEDSHGSEPLSYTQGGGQILPALEDALTGLAEGDSKEVTLAAADGYGEIDPAALQEVPIDQIPEGAREVGAQLQAEGYNGPIFVKEVRDDVIIVDFNHPLAGKELVFAIEIVSVAAD